MTANEEWHPDINIDEKLVRQCLAAQFPVLAPIQSIECIGEGWDNKVFLINDKIVFRFPHRKIFIELIKQEDLTLNKLPIFQNVKIPVLKYIGNPTIIYPSSFHGYEFIVGTPAYQIGLTEEELKNSLVDLAFFLKQLHEINEQKAGALGAKPQVWDRTNIQKSTEVILERINKVNERKTHKINIPVFENEIEAIQNVSFLDDEKCLVHGDLDFRHLLFHHQKLAGVIDWDDMGINNRSVDLGIIWSFYPQEYHEIFFKCYGQVSQEIWKYARFLGLYSGITLLLYANDINDILLTNKSKEVIKRINPDLIKNDE